MLSGTLYVVVDAVDDGALVDDEHGKLFEDGLQVADAFGNLDDLTFARLYLLLRVLYCEKLVLAEPLVCKAVAFRRLR